MAFIDDLQKVYVGCDDEGFRLAIAMLERFRNAAITVLSPQIYYGLECWLDVTKTGFSVMSQNDTGSVLLFSSAP